MQAYVVTLALFFAGWRLGVFSPARVYELFGEILSALNLFSLAFCCFLYVKARPGSAWRPPRSCSPSPVLPPLHVHVWVQLAGQLCCMHAW